MKKSALLVWGGWLGHSPKECSELFGPWLQEQGYEVEISDTLDAYLDSERLNELSLIVPIWTQGEISIQQETNSPAGGGRRRRNCRMARLHGRLIPNER